jgi:acetyltransferase-like isoleucine patch superfamily enzyme
MLKEIVDFISRNGIKTVLVHIVELYGGALLRWLPGIEGLLLRGLFYRLLFRKCGKNLLIYPHVYIIFSHRISAGQRLAINVGTYIDAGGEVEFGDYVLIGPNCVISSRDHSFNTTEQPMCFQPVQYAKIKIEDDVWLGANVFVRSGVTIGKGSVIAAGTVVSANVPPYSIFGGVPGKVIRNRNDPGSGSTK